MIKINMSVEANSHEELLEALKNAGPNVTSFYGEVVKAAPAGSSFQGQHRTQASTDEPQLPGQIHMDELQHTSPLPEPTPVYSKDEVRAELRKVMQTQGSDAMRQILSKYNCKKLDEADEKDYPAIVKDVQEALANAG